MLWNKLVFSINVTLGMMVAVIIRLKSNSLMLFPFCIESEAQRGGGRKVKAGEGKSECLGTKS